MVRGNTDGARKTMTRIVITEFLETDAVDELKRRGFEVHYDSTLWTKRAELEKLVRDLPGRSCATAHRSTRLCWNWLPS
jgi:hypothetical protein